MGNSLNYIAIMRVWDLPFTHICNQHLNGMHKEIHQIWDTIVYNRKAWSNHPETNRWRDCLKALANTHDFVVAEFLKRKPYNHQTPIIIPSEFILYPEKLGREFQSKFWQDPGVQRNLLINRCAKCRELFHE